jgi:Ca2+-binding EF-hand superfamily protein
MDKAACELQKTLTIVERGECIHPSSEPEVHTKGETCMQHSYRIMELIGSGDPDWQEKCSLSVLQQKSDSGTITMRDIIDCYWPYCDDQDSDLYRPKQCHSIGTRHSKVDWCWCSGPAGLSIPDTLTSDMPENQCTQRSLCHYQGSQYSDGQVFEPVHGCGICECLDGNVTCFEEFVPDVDGQLNSTQLDQLSDLLKQFFYFENNHKDSILYDIRDISRIISDSESYISNDTQMSVLREWFRHYDSDGNGGIEVNHTEETSFHDHIHQFTSCKHFLDHISIVFDVDSSGTITEAEWLDFFIRHTSGSESADSVGRRSVQRRRRSLQDRRKFYYFLSS